MTTSFLPTRSSFWILLIRRLGRSRKESHREMRTVSIVSSCRGYTRHIRSQLTVRAGKGLRAAPCTLPSSLVLPHGQHPRDVARSTFCVEASRQLLCLQSEKLMIIQRGDPFTYVVLQLCAVEVYRDIVCTTMSRCSRNAVARCNQRQTSCYVDEVQDMPCLSPHGSFLALAPLLC